MSQPPKPGPPNVHGTGPVRLRQLALVARDLQAAQDLLTYVLGAEVLYVDPVVAQWGLENFLVAVGGEVIEVVSPVKEGTTAGRLLEKRGDGGYMVIMQHPDARKRREWIEKKGLAKVVYSHVDEESGVVSLQFHPKGLKGGVIPELTTHPPSKAYPDDPLKSRFSPWHPCGPDPAKYIPIMQKTAHLSLLGAVTRLAPGDWGSERASTQWEETFGVPRSRDLATFTNAKLGFLHGEEGEREGLISISIGVKGEKKRQEIFRRAEERGVVGGEGPRKWVEMVGLRWYFVLTEDDKEERSRL